MHFALAATTQEGDQTLVWSDSPPPYVLVGSDYLIQRAERLVLLGRTVGGAGLVASLDTPYQAYHTLVAVMREHGGVQGPIDFAGVDDDGYPMTFMPMPEADHTRSA